MDSFVINGVAVPQLLINTGGIALACRSCPFPGFNDFCNNTATSIFLLTVTLKRKQL